MATDDDQPALRHRPSDLPADLGQEREAVVRQFLRKGFELTEGVLEENRQLHARIELLESDVARLRAQVASDDAIRDLLRTIDKLELERRELLDRRTQLEETRRQSEHRNTEIEQELHDLANLYIASSHLHASLSVRGVVRHLKELLQQLVGAEAFVIYLVTESGGEARPIAQDGYDGVVLEAVAPGEGAVGESILTGIARVDEDVSGQRPLDAPMAVVPLSVRSQVVGVIAITRVFEQKSTWATVDHELFKLLGSHAGTALLAANLYVGPADAYQSLKGVLDHLTPLTRS